MERWEHLSLAKPVAVASAAAGVAALAAAAVVAWALYHMLQEFLWDQRHGLPLWLRLTCSEPVCCVLFWRVIPKLEFDMSFPPAFLLCRASVAREGRVHEQLTTGLPTTRWPTTGWL